MSTITGSRAYERFSGNQIAKIAVEQKAKYVTTLPPPFASTRDSIDECGYSARLYRQNVLPASLSVVGSALALQSHAC